LSTWINPKRNEVRFTKTVNAENSRKNSEASTHDASATEPMLDRATSVEEGNGQTQVELEPSVDFTKKPCHTDKVLNLRDFCGKSDNFVLQQTSLCKDVLYIFAIDMAQKLDETPKHNIEGRKWRKLRGIFQL
jgi:hypothetical protein